MGPSEREKATLPSVAKYDGIDPRDLSTLQITELRNWLNEDLFAFCWFIFEYRDLQAKLHGNIASLLTQWGKPGFERLMVQIPREFFKTSLCTRANALWQICRDPDKSVAIFSERLDNASSWVRTIRDVVASSRLFHVVYRDLLPPGIAYDDTRSMPRWWKWSDTEIVLQRGVIMPEASITALGVGAASAGRHWHKIIKDDIISEDAANSQVVMQTAVNWFDKSLYLERPALKGWDLIVCTPWAYDDVYAHILRSYNYKLYRRSALEDESGESSLTGDSIFPEKLKTGELLTHYRRDPFGFNSQMMCQPKPGRDQTFDTSWIRYGQVEWDDDQGPRFVISKKHYTTENDHVIGLEETPPRIIPLRQMNKMILCDPAPSEEGERRRDSRSRNALVVEGMDPWGRRFILDTWAGRLDPMEIINQMFSLMDKWGTDTIAIEEVIFSKLYRHWLLREADLRRRYIRPLRLKPDKKSKGARIREKIPGMKSGLYYWDSNNTDDLLKEYMEYPYGGTEDLLDAWAYDAILKRPDAPEEIELRLMHNRRGYSNQNGRDPITGY